MTEPYRGHAPHEPKDEAGTSLAAAESMEDVRVPMGLRVYQFILQRGEDGATDDEIEESLGYRHQTASARRRELFLKERIFRKPADLFDNGLRKTRSGRMAQVWVGKEWA